MLGTRCGRNAAASTAAASDLVILSMSGNNPLPAPVEEWIEMWTWLIDNRKPAVLALFAAQDSDGARVRAYLQKGAISKGLKFFSHVMGTSRDTTRDSQPSSRARTAVDGARAALPQTVPAAQ